jgi:hypothetical protein
METKAHVETKANVSMESSCSNLEYYFTKSKDTVTDRIVETYRGIIQHLTPDVTFEATIDVMIALGCFSSLKTKNELRILYDLRQREIIK